MSEIQMVKNNENMSNISKTNNRRQMGIKSTIQQKTNQFWDYYSKFLIRFSWLILIISLLLTIGLTICFFCFIQVRHFDQTDFLVQNGRALKNIQHIEKVYGSDKNFRVHQQMDLYPALDIIIKRKLPINRGNINEANMLNNQTIDEIHSLDKKIQSIQINNSDNSIEYNYSSLCAIINHACMIDGNYLLSNKFRQDALKLQYIPSGIYFDSLTGANGIASFIFGKHYQIKNETLPEVDYDEEEEEDDDDGTTPIPLKQIVSYVPIFRLRYALNISNDEMRSLALNWERKILHYLNEKFQSKLISVFPSTSTALTDAINKQAQNEGPFMAIMLLIFFIFVCFFISIQGNFHTSVGYLSLCGIINLALSSGATFGLLSVFQIQIIEPMALIVIVIAIIDCMRVSIVCGEYHRIIKEHLPTSSTTNVSTKIDIERILPSIIKSTRSYFICSTIILIIVYLIISFLSPMSCTRNLGLTLILYIFVNYLTHCTFFSSCLIITLKRIQSRRHCLFCHHLPNDYYIKDRRKSLKKIFFQKPIEFLSNIDPIFKKFFTGFLCLLSLIFVISSIWLVLSIDTRLFDEKFLPKNATSLRLYMKSQMEDYEIGPVIMFVIPKRINYENKNNQRLMHKIVEQCLNETTTGDFKLLWLEHEDIKNILTGKDPLSLRITPYSQNDLVISEGQNKSIIKASRFYCQYKSIKGDRNDLRIMNNMYNYAQQSSISSIFPYSIIFPHYESLGQIRIEIYLLILVMVIITFIITLLIFFSFGKTLLIFLHLLILLSGSLTCLYLFHNLTFNFANALWLFIVPVIYVETFIHATFNITKSKWKYNRVIISLIMSLIILSFFPIETYIFHIICYSLIYQSIICLILINLILPSWYYIIETYLKKNKKEKMATTTIVDANQSSTVDAEIQNLVYEPNGNVNGSI